MKLHWLNQFPAISEVIKVISVLGEIKTITYVPNAFVYTPDIVMTVALMINDATKVT